MDYTLIGTLVVAFGVLLLFFEIFQPGFFIAIPATVALVLGLIIIIFKENAFSSAFLVLMVFIALGTLWGTISLYEKLAPPESVGVAPDASYRKGVIGRVTVPVDPHSIKGKVKIHSEIHSARSEEKYDLIPEGTKVEVVSSEGVHVVVRPVDGIKKKTTE
jgi:inner membrane protein